MRLIVPILHLELPSAKTIKGANICELENVVNLSVMWIDTPESMIQDERDKLDKQIPECAKVVMFKVETECIF